MCDEPIVHQQPAIRILLHGEDGLFPFLSPHLLTKYFPPTDALVENHVILGIAVKETCIVPLYEDASLQKKVKKRKKHTENHRHTIKRARTDCNADSKCSVDTNKPNATPDDVEMEGTALQIESKKPIGFTFEGMPICSHLRLVPGYKTMAVPTFDLLDDLKSYNDAMTKCKAKSRKQSSSTPPPARISSAHDEISLCTPKGMQKISPELYTKSVHGLQCDSFVGLFDQVLSTDGKRRKMACGERTKVWLSQCLNHVEKVGEGNPIPQILAPIVCQIGDKEFKEAIDNIITLEKKIAGIVLVGWHHIASRQDRVSILKQVSNPINPLSRDKFSQKDLAVLAVSDMKQFLDAVRGGVNVIGTTLPASMARSKHALMLDLYNWEKISGKDNCDDNKNEAELDGNGCQDLSCVTFLRDTTVLIPGCSCPSCAQDKHTRAYIHHLINCKELLADILLFSHNLYQITLLCKEMSNAMQKGKLDQFCSFIDGQLK